MKIKTLVLCTLAASVAAYGIQAEMPGSGPRYTPRPVVARNNYTQTNHTEDRMDAHSYEQYEKREPCQHYRRMPRDYIGSCGNKHVIVATMKDHRSGMRLLPIIHSYTVLFDFDKSAVRSNEDRTLQQVVSEIDKYNPQQITVTGYTDSSGTVKYNQNLSHQREQSVSKALMERGIKNYTIDRDARGEYDQAVQTDDGIKNQDNRRVVIDFRR